MESIDVDKIIALRKHYQITQEDAAKVLDIGRVTYVMREKHGSFNDDELNKLSKLLKVARSELVKKDASLPSLERSINFNANALYNQGDFESYLFSPQQSKNLKLKLPADAKKTIESEFIYKAKYINLLEDQLRIKEEMVIELNKMLIRSESETKLMFEKFSNQFLELRKEIKIHLQKKPNHPVKAAVHLNKKTKKLPRKGK